MRLHTYLPGDRAHALVAVDEVDARARIAESHPDGPAYALRAAADQCDTSIEADVHAVPPRWGPDSGPSVPALPKFLTHDTNPVSDPIRDDVVVEVVSRRMGGVERAVCRNAVAYAHEGARTDLHHLGEILTARCRAKLAIDLVGTDDRAGSRDGDLDLLGLVDQCAWAAFIGRFRPAAPGLGRTTRKPPDAALDQVAHFGRVGSGRASDDELGGDNVRRYEGPPANITDADHSRIKGRDVAADDTLEAQHEMGLRVGDVGRALRREAAMAADAAERDDPAVRGGEHRPLAGRKRADWHAGRVVQAVYGVAGKVLEKAVAQHGERAAASLLGRLEDQVQRAAEIRISGEIPCRAEQHCGVAVMAAGVHPARI